MDRILFIVAVCIIVAGFLILASASSIESEIDFGHPYGYLLHQLWAGLGLGLGGFVLAKYIPRAHLKGLVPFLFFATLILLTFVLVPQVGLKFGGAWRWLGIGGFSFQPSELAKITFILYLAKFFEARKREMHRFKDACLPFLIWVGIVGVLLLMQPDIGTLLVLVGSAGVMYFVAGGKLLHLGSVLVLGLVIILLLAFAAPYRKDRIMVFLQPDLDPEGAGYHVRQSLTAIATGGFFGKGLALGKLKTVLPEPMNDSIFAVLAEETGFLGVIIVSALYFLFYVRSLVLAKGVRDSFGQLAVVGLASWIFLQTTMHIASVSGLAPFTGLPLPFISYGGTNYLVALSSLGLIFNITKQT